jgi:hypothetical protein
MAEPDHRSLFEKLQQQKAAKEEAFQEANRFNSLLRRLDNDEVDFLVGVQEQKEKEDRIKRRRTEEALSAFRIAQQAEDARLAALEDERRVQQHKRGVKTPVVAASRVQKRGLTGVIKKNRKKTAVAAAISDANGSSKETARAPDSAFAPDASERIELSNDKDAT